jgi:mutator protein MutT
MIALANLRLMPNEPETNLKNKAAAMLGILPEEIKSLAITKKSLDARKKADIHYTYSVEVAVKGDEDQLISRVPSASKAAIEPDILPKKLLQVDGLRPVVVGFGPAGMFASLYLAEANLRPIVLEQGYDAQTRLAVAQEFWSRGRLDPNCNVQFGEGGAGTFSDGKLNTNTKDARIGFVLDAFVRFGAPANIRYDAKPHIGTDILVRVVQNIRKEIIALGGEVRFGHKLTAIKKDDNAISAVAIQSAQGESHLPCRHLVLAIGHSARDTFEMLHSMGVNLQPKAFSMGVRIEHLQADIDAAQYGRVRGQLPPADYKLACHLPNGESAYTFCMCPGGIVVAASSQENGVVTNGMSYSTRGGKNANAALLVSVKPEDFPDSSPLSGMRWQRQIEQRAFEYAGSDYRAPAQLAGDFIKNIPTTAARSVSPTYRPGVQYGDLREVLPEKITDTIAKALPILAHKLRGFDNPDAVLTAPETRSSSPVRIVRNESLQSELKGLFPCGEGAGYAGGITSAAVDGLRCAKALTKLIQEEMNRKTKTKDIENQSPRSRSISTKKTAARVVAALIWEGDRFMICRRPAHKARGLLWEFVGGKVEPTETDRQALIRECREELGIDLDVDGLYMQVVHSYPDLDVQLILYHAVIVRGTPQKLEHEDIRWIVAGEIPEYEFCPADTDIIKRISLDAAEGRLPPLK